MTRINPKVNLIQTETLYKGAGFTLLGIVKNGRCLVREYIEGLQKADRTRLVALLERVADAGPPSNPQKFKKVEGTSFAELKSYQDRIPCFFDGRGRLVLTHGFKKKKDRWSPAELKRTADLQNEYLQAKSRPEAT